MKRPSPIVWAALGAVLMELPVATRADPPVAMYVFPAGGQRGTDVTVRVGGLYLHESAPFVMSGSDITADPRVVETDTVWFEGPVIPLPDSQQAEDYPKDHSATIRIASGAVGSTRTWRVWTSQGVTSARTFVLGDLPELVEEEIDGRPVPVAVAVPITINGRIFPREDVDIWTFAAREQETFTLTALGASLGSPLELRLEVRDPAGRPLAESNSAPLPGSDASLCFTTGAAGTYSVRIHDLKFGGLQHYVYRLSITRGPSIDRVFPLGGQRGTEVAFSLTGQQVAAGPVTLRMPTTTGRFEARFPLSGGSASLVPIEIDELLELVEDSNRIPEAAAAAPRVPGFVGNGRILQPAEVDVWPVLLKKGEVAELEVRAGLLGSPLDSVLAVTDETGRELAQNDDLGGSVSDSRLSFTAPADGTYLIRVWERDPDRAGEAFAYRLKITPPAMPDFRLTLPADVVSVPRKGEAKFKLKVEALGGFAGEVALSIDGLPTGVTVTPEPLVAKPGDYELTFKGGDNAAVGAVRLTITGTARVGEQMVSRRAIFSLDAAGRPSLDTLWLAVTIPTPFKVKGVYEVKYAQRGSRFVRRFSLDRGDYTGPLTVRLADRQTRHLQGVVGPTIEVPPGVSEFEYPVFLPPWMEVGRTSRTVVMAVGEVADASGTKHKVSFTSLQQNEQIVALVDPGQLSVDLSKKTVAVAAGQTATISVRVGRGTGIVGPARVEVVIPRHMRGVTAGPQTIAADAETGEVRLEFAPDTRGPFNHPVIVRATVLKNNDVPFVAEAKLDLVVEPSVSDR